MKTRPVMTENNHVSSDVEYTGNRTGVRTIMKAMRVNQNSISINGWVIIKRGRNKYEYGRWMGDFHTGTIDQVISVIC